MTDEVQYTAAGEGVVALNAPDAVLTVKVDVPRGSATPLPRTSWPKAT